MASDSAPRRVLVLTNSVERSGAPIALLRLIRWCVGHGLIEPTFVTREGGELLDEFRSLGPTYRFLQGREERIKRMVADLPGGRPATSAGRFLVDHWLRRLCRRHRIELIYANTATHRRMLDGLAPLDLPIITHVHELERVLAKLDATKDLGPVIRDSTWLLAVSDAVRDMLVASGAHDEQIRIVPGMINGAGSLSAEEKRAVRRDLFGVDDDSIIVVGCGTPSLIKGTDLFLRVAQKALAMRQADDQTGLVFAWIGASPENESAQTLAFDAERLQLSEHVHAIPRIQHADHVLGAADIFLSPSREDSNPLAALEAAVAGLPTICFRGAGGADELADAGGAVAVPYLDTDAMAEAVGRLVRESDTRRALGAAARRVVLQHHSPDAVGSRLTDLFQRRDRS